MSRAEYTCLFPFCGIGAGASTGPPPTAAPAPTPPRPWSVTCRAAGQDPAQIEAGDEAAMRAAFDRLVLRGLEPGADLELRDPDGMVARHHHAPAKGRPAPRPAKKGRKGKGREARRG